MISAGPADAATTLPTLSVSAGPDGLIPEDFGFFYLPAGNTGALGNGATATAVDLSGFSFTDNLTTSIGSASGGAGAGKATFSPVTLTVSDPNLTAQLFQILASGGHFKNLSVTETGLDPSSGNIVSDTVYNFSTVFITNLAVDSSGQTQVTLQYGGEQIETETAAANGVLGVNHAASWSQVTNASDPTDFTSIPAASLASVAPLAATVSTPSQVAPLAATATSASSNPVTYYVRFTLPGGGSSLFDGKTLYQLNAFSFQDANSSTVGSASGGAAAGKANFGPLSLSFTQQSLLPDLFHTLASGLPFAEVDVIGYSTGSSTTTNPIAVEYSFGTVLAGTLAIDDSGMSTATLQYESEAIHPYVQMPDGTTVSEPTDVWDQVTNTANFATPTSPMTTPAAAPQTLQAAQTVSPAVDNSGLTYYVRFTPRSGAAGSFDGTTLYQLNGFSFGDANSVQLGSASGGAGAGKATFNPLALTFSQPTLAPELFQALASNSQFGEVDVLGYGPATPGNAGNLAVDDSFGLVLASNLAVDGNGQITATLNYGSESIQTYETTITDPGPTASSATVTEGHGQTVNLTALIDSLVSPGIAGDTELLTSMTAATGAVVVSGDRTLQDGTTTIAYTVPISGPDTISYMVTDQNGASASGRITVAIDPGPTAGTSALTLGHSRTADLAALISTLVTSGLTGDTETLTSATATTGTVALVTSGIVLGSGTTLTYAAPAHGPDTINYTVTDGYGDTASGQVAVTVDPGPTAANGTLTLGHGRTTNLAALINTLVTPGLTGDTETLTGATATIGTVAPLTSGIVLGSGTTLTYSAPAHGPDTINYTVTDGYGDTASGQVAVTIDPGPTAANGALTIGHGRSTNIAALISTLVTPGLTGDTETLTSVTTSGTATLPAGGLVLGSAATLTYSAPTHGPDTINYMVTDGYGDTASGQVAVTVDPGPTAGASHLYLAPGQSVDLTSAILASVSPGLPADRLTLSAVNTAGTSGIVTLTGGDLRYAAPSSGSTDHFAYTVSDQYQDTATGTVSVALTAALTGNANLTLTGAGNVVAAGNGNDNITGGTGGSFVTLGNGNNNVTIGGGGNVLSVGGGNDNVSITGGTGANQVTLGNGNDNVTLGGGGNTVNAGNGNDSITVTGGGSRITLGTGHDTVTLSGSANTVNLGAGKDTVNAGIGDTININATNLTLHGGNGAMVFVNGGPSTIDDMSSGMDAVIGTASKSVTISDFSRDVTGFVDLTGRVGGYSSVARVVAALTSDGHGGTVLALGGAVSIDFVNTPSSFLTAAHFRIG